MAAVISPVALLTRLPATQRVRCRAAPRAVPLSRSASAPRRRRARVPPSAALSPEAARAAVDAALRGDAESLAAATGHYVNAAAAVGLPDVALFLLAVGAPPLALAVRFGTRALGAVALTSGLMVLPTLSLLTRPPPKDRADVAPVPLLCLMAAEAVALARCFVFNG